MNENVQYPYMDYYVKYTSHKEVIMYIEDLFDKLCKEKESEYLDYKEVAHKFNDDLIHDILCMANSKYPGNKYIVLGVTDSGDRIGLINLIKDHELTDFLRGKFNRSLENTIIVDDISHQGKNFQIITIIKRMDGPFFLVKDFKDSKKTKPKSIRAGVIYTRHGSTNTPVDSTASDDEIEAMWRARFALDLPPLERFMTYLDDYENWSCAASGDMYYYTKFPDFRLKLTVGDQYKFEKIPPNYKFLKHNLDPTGNVMLYTVDLVYFDISLKKVTGYIIDNGRIFIPFPPDSNIKYPENQFNTNQVKNHIYEWHYTKDSVEYKIGRLKAHFSIHNCKKSSNYFEDLILRITKIRIQT